MKKSILLILVALIAAIPFAAVTAAETDPGIEVLGIEVLGIEVLGIEVLGIEVLGIEVLGIEVLSNGDALVAASAPNAPAGSTAEAVLNVAGENLTLSAAPIDPNTGMTTVHIPANLTGQATIIIRAPTGEVLGGYLDEIEIE